jgi:hypothetical protein
VFNLEIPRNSVALIGCQATPTCCISQWLRYNDFNGRLTHHCAYGTTHSLPKWTSTNCETRHNALGEVLPFAVPKSPILKSPTTIPCTAEPSGEADLDAGMLWYKQTITRRQHRLTQYSRNSRSTAHPSELSITSQLFGGFHGSTTHH